MKTTMYIPVYVDIHLIKNDYEFQIYLKVNVAFVFTEIRIVYESNLKNIGGKWICLMIKNCVGYILYCCLIYFIDYIVSALFT